MNNPYWHEYKKPHVVDFEGVRDHCFQAFSIISASRSMMGLSSDEVGGILSDTFHEKAEERLARLFLDIALQMRTFEDFLTAIDSRKEYDAYVKKTFESGEFGSLGSPGTFERSDLSFRDVCNKIIHTDDFRPVYDNGSNPRDEDFSWGMEGIIELRGRLGAKEWDAWVSAEEFLSACLLIANFVEREDKRESEGS